MKEEITIDGVVYMIKKSNPPIDGMPYVIIRTLSAGVFAGYLAERNGMEGRLLCARRLWYWAGAASLSQLATDGTKEPLKCKFPVELAEVVLTQIIEIIPVTEAAKNSIAGVTIWKM